MAARAIATLSLTFGLVSIPVKVYSATESSSAVRFKLMGRGGARVCASSTWPTRSMTVCSGLDRGKPACGR